MNELLLELNNKNNALLMGGAWVMIQYIWTPLAHWVVMSQAMLKWRKRLQKGSNGIKKASGLLWCSLAVWIPSAQPALCDGDYVEGECQTIFARVSMGIILGGALSGGHWAGKATLMKFTGKTKKHRVTCVNCRTKIQVDDWDDKCTNCGKDPHNKQNGETGGGA